MPRNFSEPEAKIIRYLASNGPKSEAEIIEALKMDPGLCSRSVSSLEGNGDVSKKSLGQYNEQLITLEEQITVAENGDIILEEGIPFPKGQELADVISDLGLMKGGKTKKLIPRLVDAFKKTPAYQSAGGLRYLLAQWGITDVLNQNAIVDSMYPGSNTPPNQNAPQLGQNMPPVYVLGPEGLRYLPQPQQGNSNQPIIITQPASTNPPNQQPLIIETKEKRKFVRPVLQEGKIVKMPQGEKCPYCNGDLLCESVEEPVTVQVGPNGPRESILDIVKGLRDLGIIGQNQNSGQSSEVKALEEKLREAEKALQNKQLQDILKETTNGISGLQSAMNLQFQEMEKDRQNKEARDRLELEYKFKLLEKDKEIAAKAGASPDERFLSMASEKVIGGTIKDIISEARAAGGLPRPPGGQLGGQATNPIDAAAEMARRLNAA